MTKNKFTQYNSIWTRDSRGRFNGRKLISEYGILGELGLVESQFGHKLHKIHLSAIAGISAMIMPSLATRITTKQYM